MELVQPGLGLIVWNSITFLTVLFVLSKYAWKPIMAAIKEREDSIDEALSAAQSAKAEMAKLQSESDKLMTQARLERDKMLLEAQNVANKMVNDAKDKAINESNVIIENAKTIINNEKQSALVEVRNHVAVLSLEIAEKILRKELKDNVAQKQLVESYMQESKLN